ncbi:hypothetical protein TTHT_1249 [Thermotomaculum hydrothermale]|uniref:Uncharacterized protein n=1 Tax=Thermotomaculum hydrothermale TaxID=981385 RepID=A0A7R6PMD0_9BACT|nr:hypothetical protein [Thermotomaculum hydrothermale]BBB32767.1 hypothetical protein TTHT_1249 [Thermotomaculum hydrothermale]
MNKEKDNVTILLDNLEKEIKRLRIEYNRELAHMPDVNLEFAEQRVKELIKTLRRIPFKKYIHKFRFENLLARYNVQKINFNRLKDFQEKKYQKLKEEGLITVPLVDAKEENRTVVPQEEKVVIGDIKSEEQKLQKIYNDYKIKLESQKKQVNVPYEVFKKKIYDRFQMIKEKNRNAKLQIRLVEENDKVKIKTKVVKDGQ